MLITPTKKVVTLQKVTTLFFVYARGSLSEGYCTWTWMNNNGVNGHLVTGPNGNSIFLPAAGHCYYSEPSEVGNGGYYWSSSLREEVVSNACYLVAYPDDIDWSGGLRCSGRTIRPVRTKQN